MKHHPGLLLSVILLSVNSIILCQSYDASSIGDLQSMVERDKKGALTWWYCWIGGYTAATVGQGIVALSSDERSLRQDMVLGAGTTFLGAVGTLITPVVPGKAVMQNYGFQTGDSVSDVMYYELMLKEIAEREKAGRSWKIHAVAGAVNLGSGLITWLGFKRTVWDGIINFAMNTAITEAQIWSQPMRGANDYKRYCSEKTGELPPMLKKPESKLYLGTYPGGIMLRVVF
jgi:hypothetical protein